MGRLVVRPLGWGVKGAGSTTGERWGARSGCHRDDVCTSQERSTSGCLEGRIFAVPLLLEPVAGSAKSESSCAFDMESPNIQEPALSKTIY